MYHNTISIFHSNITITKNGPYYSRKLASLSNFCNTSQFDEYLMAYPLK